MGIFDFILGAKSNGSNGGSGGHNGNGHGLEDKLDELLAHVKKLEASHRDGSYGITREIKDLRGQEVAGREEVLKRIESVQEKLQFATEEYVATDEDVKQMVRNCLKSRAKTFNELQRETKISPQALHKYLRIMKSEVEEFNGVYRIVFSSSLVYVGKNGSSNVQSLGEGDKHLLELVESDAVYGAEFQD